MSTAPSLFAVSDASRKRPRDVPPASRPHSSPPPALAPQPVACPRCTYINDDVGALCEMCGELLPEPGHTSASTAVSSSYSASTSVQRYVDDEPITIEDDDEEGKEELFMDEDEVELLDVHISSTIDSSAPMSSSSPSALSPPQPSLPTHHGRRVTHIPPPPRADSSNGGQTSSPSSSFSSLFFTSSPASASYPPPLPSNLMPLSYIHLPTLPFASPLSAGLLSARRFATAQMKGEMSLLSAQLLIDSRIDTQLLSPLLACLCRLGVQYRVQQLAVAYSVELYERETSYGEYKERHERFVEQKENGKAATDNSKPPLDSLTAPLSTRLIPTFFLIIAPRIFCRMYASKQLHEHLKQLEARARSLQQASGADGSGEMESGNEKEENDVSASSARYQSPFSVHLILWGLVSLVAQQKQERKDYRAAAATASAPSAPPPALPFSSVSSLTSLSSLWLRSGGVCRVEFHHPSPTDAVAALLLHFRHAASARYKRFDEERTFTFGSLRVVKGRTSAMRGANPLPRRKRKSRRAADGESSSDSTTDDSDDGQSPAAANDSTSAANVLLSYSESWIHMLCMVSGVSEERAAVIARPYPSVRALTDAYHFIHTSTRQEYDEWKRDERKVESEPQKKVPKGRLIVAAGETDDAAVARIASERCSLLLADLMCGQRRLGDELSKRVYRALST